MEVLLAKTGNSIFNRSIWQGISRSFRDLGHAVRELDNESVPDPRTLSPRPDLLFAVHGGTLSTDIVERYRESGVLTAVYLLDEPYEVDRSTLWARHYDWVFTVDRATVAIHDARSQAFFLPLGYDDSRFRPDGKAYRSEILVLGSPYEHRLHLLAPFRARWGHRTTWVGPGWRPFCPQGRHVDQLVTPDICARFYRGAEVVINIHRDSSWSHFGPMNSQRIPATHLNPRFWEAAACGAFQLCSFRDDLSSFSPDTATFAYAEELMEHLDHFWPRPSERERQAGLTTRAVASHTYRARVEQLLRVLPKEAVVGPSHAG